MLNHNFELSLLSSLYLVYNKSCPCLGCEGCRPELTASPATPPGTAATQQQEQHQVDNNNNSRG